MSRRNIYQETYYYKVVLFFIAAVIGTFNVAAQTKGDTSKTEPVHIVNAELMEFNSNGTQAVRTLTGNVQLEQKGVTLFCDKADFYQTENNVEAYGHVRVRQDTINIYSDRLSYKGNERKAKFFTNVRLTDTKMTLLTDQLDYDMNTKVGNYNTGGTLKNDSSVLTSQVGYYYTNDKNAFFKKNVKLVNPKYVLTADTLKFNTASKTAYFCGPTNIHSDSSDVFCEGGYYNTANGQTEFNTKAIVINYPHIIKADTIFYDRNTGNGRAFSHVDWIDTGRHIIIRCNKAFYDDKKSNITAMRNPVFIDASEKDSLFMKADTLFSAKADTGDKRIFLAYHHVKIYRSDMQVLCDSLSYSDVDSLFHFYKDPILWVDNNQLTADSISLLRGNKNIKNFFMRQNSLIVNEADSGEYNQIQGKTITGYFEKSKLNKLDVRGNGETIYFASDEKKKPIGVNKAVCSNIMIWIKEDKVARIKFMEKPEAILYPPGKAPEDELKLKGFRWEILKKPVRAMF